MKLLRHLLLYGILYVSPLNVYSQVNQKEKESKMGSDQTPIKSTSSERVFIDRFVVPQTSKQEFVERMDVNRNFIKNLPGFVEDAAYERLDEQGNLIIVTIATWENEDAIRKAKEAVQAEYKKEGFNMQAMLERLKITMMERGVYTKRTK
jgi:heme-degrading monooxygenase HmoA